MLSHKEQIGRLDRRITFQQKVTQTDTESNQKKVTGWQNISTTPTVYASVDESSGSEVIQAQQLNGLKTSIFIVRYRADLSIENRIVYNGEYYDIHVILEVSRKRYLRIIAESGGQYTEGESEEGWVLSTGTWDDEEYWKDDGIWNDGV